MMTDDLLQVDWASFLWEEIEVRGGIKIDPSPIKSGDPSQDPDETLAHLYTTFEVPENEGGPQSLEDFHMIYSRPVLISLAREIVGMGTIKVGCLPFVTTDPGNRLTITFGKIPVRFQVGYKSSNDGPGKYVVQLDVLVEEVRTAEAVGS